jgi:hypothetical protein
MISPGRVSKVNLGLPTVDGQRETSLTHEIAFFDFSSNTILFPARSDGNNERSAEAFSKVEISGSIYI